jgi:serine/threonine-protein phosphatase 2A activator
MQSGSGSFQPPTAAPWAAAGPPGNPHGPISGPLGPPPAPLPGPLPVIPLPHEFVVPQKRISSRGDLETFGRSSSGQLFLAYIASLSKAVENRKLSDECALSTACAAIVGVLDRLAAWVDDIPPAQQQARYGNPAYRFWQEQLGESVGELQRAVLPPPLHAATAEVAPYFLDSFGNSSRIDYGTGACTRRRWACLAVLFVSLCSFQSTCSR